MSLSLPTLDRARHVGIVFPPENDAHYHQDGFYFDREGKLVEELLDEVGRARLKRVAAKAIAKAAAKKAIVEVLVKDGYAAEEAEKIAEEDTSDEAVTDAEKPEEVDLVRWAKGQRKYLWHQVAKAAKEQHAFGATTKIGLIDFLLEEGIVTRDEVKV